jgi:hypothetical protein
MKKLFKSAMLIMISGILVFGIQGCNKYPDGPTISFKSRTDRISNVWKVDNYKVNGTDFTTLVSGYTETFTKGGTYSYNWGILSGSGTWQFQNKDEEVKISGLNNQSDVTLFILKLEEKQFWYYIMDGDDKKEFHMIQ